MGCMKETLDLFKRCPACNTSIEPIWIFPFLTLEDWAGYKCAACGTWIDAWISKDGVERPKDRLNRLEVELAALNKKLSVTAMENESLLQEQGELKQELAGLLVDSTALQAVGDNWRNYEKQLEELREARKRRIRVPRAFINGGEQ